MSSIVRFKQFDREKLAAFVEQACDIRCIRGSKDAIIVIHKDSVDYNKAHMEEDLVNVLKMYGYEVVDRHTGEQDGLLDINLRVHER